MEEKIYKLHAICPKCNEFYSADVTADESKKHTDLYCCDCDMIIPATLTPIAKLTPTA